MRKFNKKTVIIISLALAILIAVAVFVCCYIKKDKKGGKDFPETKKEGVIAEINSDDISDTEWDYYFAVVMKNYANSYGKYIDEIDWNEKDSDGVTLLEKAKQTVLDEIVRSNVVAEKAKEMGITLSDEDKNTIEVDWDYWLQVYGDDIYKELGIKDKSDFVKLQEKQLLQNKFFNIVSEDIQKYSDGADLTKYATNESATYKSIEIPKEAMGSSGGENGKTQIESVKSRLDGGEEFDALWLEVMGEMYSQIYGVEKTKADTYTIGKGSMGSSLESMERKILGLNIGETSNIIETDNFYAIVKRVAGYSELVNMWIEESEIKVNYDIMNASSPSEASK